MTRPIRPSGDSPARLIQEALGKHVRLEVTEQTGSSKSQGQLDQVVEAAQKSLVELHMPASPDAPQAKAVAARQVGDAIGSFMKVRTFELDIQRVGTSAVETVKVSALSGPGHNCSMAAPLVLDSKGRPRVVLKAGDTRAARTLRGEPYVKMGMIGGRWDKVGADPKKIGLEEIAEEIGAKLVPGGFLSLGDKLVPTMPNESTESDRYFAAIVKVDKDAGPVAGDLGGMELPGLMKPTILGVADALKAMDDGRVGEGARARVAYGRAFDSIGFIPELGKYVHDLPNGLKKRFDPMGLAPPVDPRKIAAKAEKAEKKQASIAPPEAAPSTATAAAAALVHDGAEKVNSVAFTSEAWHDSPLGPFIDAKTAHQIDDGKAKQIVGGEFPNQVLHLDHDRAKVAVYYLDPIRGPMVALDRVERPVIALKAAALDSERTYKDENTSLVRRDLAEVRVDLGSSKDLSGLEPAARRSALVAQAKEGRKKADAAVASELAARGFDAEISRLGAPCDASPGQTDLRYHFYGAKVDPPADASGFVPLADAIKIFRQGEGDAAAEANLLRLATAVGWIPSLGMTVERAKKLAGE